MADYNSSLPIRTENAGDAIVKVADATTPSQQLKVEADGSINTNTTFAPGAQVEITDGTDTLAVNADGSINITDNGGSITVDGSVTVSATDLDIRDLTHVSDSVKVGDGTDLMAVNGDGSINAVVTATDLDVRDLTHVSDSVKVGDGTDLLAVNADGSLNITDNGGSITVDGTVTATATDLDIRDLTHVSDSVKVGDGTDLLAVNADGSLNITDNGGSITVDGSVTVSATDLDIRDLAAATDSVSAWLKDEAGNAFSQSNPLPVSLVDYEGTEVNDYDTASAIAAGATDNHDYTAAGAFKLRTIWASASGKMKIEVQIETGAATNVFNTAFVGFNSTSSPNIEIPLRDPAPVTSGARVRIIRTNKDNQAQDLYSTISGFLV